MIKTLRTIFKQDKEKFCIPRSVQQVIPIQAVWADGVFQVGRNKFTRTYKFMDINYAVASREDQEAMFLEYSELLNSFDSGATTKITINNRRLNRQDFEKAILIPMREDGLDVYREEYNEMLLEKATGSNRMVQENPIQAVWADGVFQVGRNKFTRTYKFMDINYAVASREDQEAMFLEYSELLNSFDSGATTKITINNRRLNRQDFEKAILIPMREDGLDVYREEYNEMLLEKATGSNRMVQEKYVTVSVYKKTVEEARSYFARVGTDLMGHFARLGSKCVELDATERLRALHDFYRAGEETAFFFDLQQARTKGHSFKDFICPDSFEFERDHFKMGDRYGRVLFLRDYASYIKDDMIAELTELNRNLMLSIDIIPVPTDEAVREVENRLLGVETNITNWQRRQNANNNFSAVVPYDMEQQRKESKEFLDDLTTRDQRMMFGILTIVHTADTKKELDADTETLLTISRQHLCQMATLKFQQMDGLNTALPIGQRKINAVRTLTTESLAVLMPFPHPDNGKPCGADAFPGAGDYGRGRHLLRGECDFP